MMGLLPARAAMFSSWLANELAGRLLRSLACAALACMASAWGQTPQNNAVGLALIPAPNIDSQLRVDARGSHWVDVNGHLSAEQADELAQSGRFVRGGPTKPLRLDPPAAVWIRLDVQRSNDTHSVYLVTANPGLDHIELHWKGSDRAWQSQVSGDRLALDKWPEQSRKPLFRLPSADATGGRGVQTFYVRVQHATLPIFVPLYLAGEANIRSEHSWTYFILGSYFGLVLLSMLFCGVRAIRRRDKLYAIYFVLTGFMLLMQLCLTGLATQWLFSSSPWWANSMSFVSVSWYAATGTLFCLQFSQMARIAPRTHQAGLGLVGLGFAISALHLVFPNRTMFVASNFYMVLSMSAAIYILVSAHIRGARNALWCLAGFFPLIISGIPPMLRNAGLMSTSFLTQYSLVIGAAIEIVVLFLVMLKRDAELREAQVRINALASVDPLTGATDARVFLSRLHGSLLRCAQLQHRCALIRAEVTNHAWFRAEHGGEAADRATVLAASAVRHVARDVDTCARTGLAEFVLLIEGPVDATHAMKAATNILARSLRPSDALPVGATVQIHLAVAMLPHSLEATGQSAQEILEWLRAQHAAAPRTGRSKISSINW